MYLLVGYGIALYNVHHSSSIHKYYSFSPVSLDLSFVRHFLARLLKSLLTASLERTILISITRTPANSYSIMVDADEKASNSKSDDTRRPLPESEILEEETERPISGNYLDNNSPRHQQGQNLRTDAPTKDSNSIEGTDLDEKDSVNATDLQQGSSDDVTEVNDRTPNQRDLEAGEPLETKTSKCARSIQDPDLVTWDGPDDKQNPKNWSTKRKWAATIVGEN